MALLAIGLERGLEGVAIDGAFDRRHAARGELRAGVPWQGEKGPGPVLCALGRPEEFGFETDRFGHCLTIVIGMRFFEKIQESICESRRRQSSLLTQHKIADARD